MFLPAGDSCAQKVPQIHSGNELGALFKEFVFPIYYILCNSTDFKTNIFDADPGMVLFFMIFH